MKLWHMHSDVLDGFYSSEVYVAATSRSFALIKGMEAYDRYIEEYLDCFGIHPLIWDNFPEDPLFKEQSLAKRNEFSIELNQKLKPLDQPAIIQVRS